MISAFILLSRPPLDANVQAVKGVAGRHQHGTGWRECQADNARTRYEQFGLAVLGQPDDSLSAAQRCRHVQPVLRIESNSLGPAEAPVVHLYVARGGNPKNRVKTRRRWARYVEVVVRSEC